MDLMTIGVRTERKWRKTWKRDPKGRTKLTNILEVLENRQAHMNDEEAEWLLKNHPNMDWKPWSQGGQWVKLGELRYILTDKQLKAGQKPEVEESNSISRAEVQAKAKGLGIKGNQKTGDLLKAITKAEKELVA